jgi:hypothetical protein
MIVWGGLPDTTGGRYSLIDEPQATPTPTGTVPAATATPTATAPAATATPTVTGTPPPPTVTGTPQAPLRVFLPLITWQMAQP